VLRAPPDGYTLLCAAQPTFSITHLLFSKASFDPRALESVSIGQAFVAHIFFAVLLSGLVVLHVLAAFYHQFVRRDGLFRRMSFGRRVAESPALAQIYENASVAEPDGATISASVQGWLRKCIVQEKSGCVVRTAPN